MGAEKPGLSEVARAKCDGFVTIPMVGMVESFNVSVAAALLTYALSHRAPKLLSEDERRTLLARYLVRTIQRPEIVLAELSARC
jgi:tRNA (guanosine-2'-O-)-methyltransferase